MLTNCVTVFLDVYFESIIVINNPWIYNNVTHDDMLRKKYLGAILDVDFEYTFVISNTKTRDIGTNGFRVKVYACKWICGSRCRGNVFLASVLFPVQCSCGNDGLYIRNSIHFVSS